jgi:hypothetical protein
MPLTVKPHAWLSLPPNTDAPSGYGVGVAVAGRIKQSNPTEAVASFGDPAGSIQRPFMAVVDEEDAGKHVMNGLVEWKGRRFSIEMPPKVNDATAECSHALVMLAELVD